MTTLTHIFKRLDGLLSSEWQPRPRALRTDGFADVATTSASTFVMGRSYGAPYRAPRASRLPGASRLARAWADLTGGAA